MITKMLLCQIYIYKYHQIHYSTSFIYVINTDVFVLENYPFCLGVFN